MALDISKLSSAHIEQLSLGLKVDEVQIEGEVFIDPAEAQKRSMNALQMLKMKLISATEEQEKYETELREYQKQVKAAIKKGSSTNDIEEPEEPTQLFGWAADFYFLLDHGWPWRVAAYIAWAGSPKVGRWPKTQEELANQVLGLTSDRQIAKWRSENPAIDEMIGMMQAMPLLDHRRDVFEALSTSASDASSKGAQDRKTFLTMTGDYVPHQKVDIERPKTSPKEYKEEELIRAAARMDKELGIEEAENGGEDD
jgi:hypothetical protein